MVEIINVSKYNLVDFNLKVNKYDFLVIFGKGGSGKTILLKLIKGEIKPDKGEVKLSDEIKDSMCYIPQEFYLIKDLSVKENIELAMKELGYGDLAIIKEVGLNGYEKIKVKNLPQSFKQLVNIAVHTLKKPLLLLADEPTQNLDEEQENKVIEFFKNMNELGTTIVMTTNRKPKIYSRLIKLDARVGT